MAGKDIITMSQEELKRLHIIRKILDKRLKQSAATGILDLCDRQIRRLVAQVRKEGDKGVIHKMRGRPSNRALPDKLKNRVLDIYKRKYPDFGPTFANEKFLEIEKLKISNQTLRNWLIKDGCWQVTQKRRKHRQWRERKHHFGEMIQADGSYHDWFEGRRPKCVLMAYIDDATSHRFARFYEYEGTSPFMSSFKQYVKKHGIPHSVYIDKHTTYKSTAKQTIEEELDNIEPVTQVSRALKQLGVEVIYANSAPAKGRIERSFKTFQDRLVKELRLSKIKTIDDANKVLDDRLAVFNRKFGVQALEKGDLHRPVPKGTDLDAILCLVEEHALRNDFTVAHGGKLYQVLDRVNTKKVLVEERLNGRMFITYKGRRLKHREITQRPKKKAKPNYMFMLKKAPHKPPMDHPLKGPMFRARYPHIDTYSQKEKGAQKEKGLLLTRT